LSMLRLCQTGLLSSCSLSAWVLHSSGLPSVTRTVGCSHHCCLVDKVDNFRVLFFPSCSIVPPLLFCGF
uniref:Secreted protein n=1 Tax=Otolemur garnettii TaxID=30611 RepID=H0XYY8_OTOGA